MTAQSETDEYLGDGLYASFDGWQFRLWTEREPGHKTPCPGSESAYTVGDTRRARALVEDK